MPQRTMASLAEIASIERADLRVVSLCAVLARVLKELTPVTPVNPKGGPPRLFDWLRANRHNLSDFDAVDRARRVRNKVAHSEDYDHEPPPTETDILQAEVALKWAI